MLISVRFSSGFNHILCLSYC